MSTRSKKNCLKVASRDLKKRVSLRVEVSYEFLQIERNNLIRDVVEKENILGF